MEFFNFDLENELVGMLTFEMGYDMEYCTMPSMDHRSTVHKQYSPFVAQVWLRSI